METKPKFIHYFNTARNSRFSVVAACGRLVGWLNSTTDNPERVTCDKCRKAAKLRGLPPVSISAVQ